MGNFQSFTAVSENQTDTPLVEILQIWERIVQNNNDIQNWKELLSLNFDINDPLWSAKTLLAMAIETQNTEIVQLVLNHGARTDCVCMNSRYSALHFAAEKKNNDIVKLLILNGADINSLNFNEETPLHIATEHGTLEIAQTLIRNGAAITRRQDNGFTVFELAIKRNDMNFVKLFLNYGTDVNFQDSGEYAPLHTAAMYVKNPEILQLLIDNRANVNAIHISGNTPLHCAVQTHEVENARILLKNNANPNVLNNDGRTPLIIAIQVQSVQLINLLIENGADVSLGGDLGQPIHYAVKMHSRRIVEILLENGADVNANSVQGTPLRLAVAANQAENVWLMLNHGADVTLRREIENVDPSEFSFSDQNLSSQMVEMRKLYLICLHYPELFKRLPTHVLDEIEVMKNDNIIPDYDFTVFDILTENFCRLATRVRNLEIRKDVEKGNFRLYYSNYADFIEFRLKKAIEDAELFNRSHTALRHILNQVTEIPEEISEQIINYLPYDDMKRILKTRKRKSKDNTIENSKKRKVVNFTIPECLGFLFRRLEL